LRKLAIKNLRSSDLSLFRSYFENHSNIKQKSFNLDKSVLTFFFPNIIPLLEPRPKKAVHVDLTIYGPGLRRDHSLARKIKIDAKNLRLNGEVIHNPEDDPERYNLITPGDFALMEFSGSELPEEVKIILISSKDSHDTKLHGALSVYLSGVEDSMKVLTEENLAAAIAYASPDDFHPIRHWLDPLIKSERSFHKADLITERAPDDKSNSARPTSHEPSSLAERNIAKIQLFGEPLQDEVLGAIYWIGLTNYAYAINNLFPLIQRLEIQRNLQNPSFYSRLRNDLKTGCIVPPLTLAFITDPKTTEVDEKYVNGSIENGFVLDGIQRLSAIHRAFEELTSDEEREKFLLRPLHLNIIVSPSMDRLLYRMITLNNGQKPMSPRHQIDILSETIFDFDNLALKNQPHKERKNGVDKLAVNRSDVIKGYIAYLSETTAIDNKLIIEEKMDSLIAEKIIESDVGSEKYEFMDVLKWIAQVSSDREVANWFISGNNFIGVCAAARKNFDSLSELDQDDVKQAQLRFEEIFSNFDKRKIKVGDFRRKMVAEYFGNIDRFSSLALSDVILELSEV
jgi:hypothetical protein